MFLILDQSGRNRHNSYHKDILPNVNSIEGLQGSWDDNVPDENDRNANNENNNNRGKFFFLFIYVLC